MPPPQRFFCAGYNLDSAIGEGDFGGQHCAQGSQGGTHDFWDTNMGDELPPTIAPKAARAGLKLHFERARAGDGDNRCVGVETLHLDLDHSRYIRAVLGE